MIIFIISVVVAIACYVIGKKRTTLKNNFEIINSILWGEACLFMLGYLFTDKHVYWRIWMVLLGVVSMFSIVHRYYLKRKKHILQGETLTKK